ncbi:PREDICTED: heparanase-like protein 3-like [Fragaria vesca subsp. vesca]
MECVCGCTTESTQTSGIQHRHRHRIRNRYCCTGFMCEIMRSLVLLFFVFCWLYEVTHCRNSISVASQSTAADTVFVNGTAAIGSIDDDFVCATLDWWPPEKCDYGTCSWGNASLLNLVTKPLVLAPGGFFDSKWFSDFVHKAPQSVQVLTHHIYNLGPGSATDLVDKILNPSVLDGISKTFSDLQMLVKSSHTSAVAWVGESGGAYNSGHNLVTSAFVFSFWYLDQLGMSASYDTKTYCRQTLIGGNYGLLDINTFKPNPDYYSALLWQRLMGNNVLSTSFSGTKKLRTYAHCSKKTQGITVLLINLGNTTVQVDVSTKNGGSRSTLNFKEGLKDSKATKNDVREEYHITAKDGDLLSRVILLNGKELTVNSAGQIPSLEPMIVEISDPTSVAPFSIVFVHIPNITVPACK